MKHTFLLLVGVVLGFGLLAQQQGKSALKKALVTNPEPELDGTHWAMAHTSLISNKTYTATMMRLDSVVDNGPYGRKQLYVYDSLGVLLQFFDFQWDNNAWQPSYREDYDYNSQELVSLITMYDGSGNGWEPDKKEMLMYDLASGRLDEKTRMEWDNGALSWINDQKRVYTYTTDGWLEFEVAYSWEDTVWEYDWMNEYSYNMAGNRTERLNSWWANGMWQNAALDEYTYSAQSLLVERMVSYWVVPGGWTPNGKYTYAYNAVQNITQEIYFEWNGQWDYYSKVEWTYAANQDLDYQLFYYYNSGTASWDYSQKIELTYDLAYTMQDLILPWRIFEEGGEEYFNHKLDTYTRLDYNNGNWVIDSENDLYYSAYSGVGLTEVVKAGCLIYPNPAGDYILVEVPNGQKGLFSLFDISGKCVLNRQIEQGQPLNISSLPVGVYIWQLQQGTQILRGKLLKD